MLGLLGSLLVAGSASYVTEHLVEETVYAGWVHPQRTLLPAVRLLAGLTFGVWRRVGVRWASPGGMMHRVVCFVGKAGGKDDNI